jgi:hypothetical protein
MSAECDTGGVSAAAGGGGSGCDARAYGGSSDFPADDDFTNPKTGPQWFDVSLESPDGTNG